LKQGSLTLHLVTSVTSVSNIVRAGRAYGLLQIKELEIHSRFEYRRSRMCVRTAPILGQ